jgi:23S rRNA (guanosine2251-2'-O)-methyltransferase
MKKDLIYGLHAVLAALEKHPDDIENVMLADVRRDERAESVITAARAASIAIERVDRDTLDQLAGNQKHQGVIAHCCVHKISGEAELSDFLAGLPSNPLLLVLDGVQDPHNLGACLRSADAAGAGAVILSRDRSASITPAVRRTASGAAEALSIFQVANLARALDRLKAAGIWLVGADHQAAKEIYDIELVGPMAIVLGGEGKGLRRLTRERCDWLVRLPMLGSVSNLNVAVATGIFLYEALRQRRPKQGPA